jgi:diguanylate cyclase (GGDEF)-like protein/PAS domain S-box-containing protein
MSARDTHKPTLDRGWWVIMVSGIYIVLFFLWTQFHWGGKHYQTLIGNLAYIPVNLALVVMWWRTALHPALPLRIRWGCRLLTAGALCNFIASSIAWGFIELVFQEQPFPASTLSDDVKSYWVIPSALVLYIVCPLLLLGSILLTEAIKSRAELFKFYLDIGIVLLGIGTPIWYFLIRPILETHPNTPAIVLLLNYPATTLALLFIVLVILLKDPGPQDHSSLRCLALAMLVNCIADTIFNYLIQKDAYQTGDPVDTLYMVSSLLMMISAQWEYVFASVTSPTRQSHQRHNPFRSLPYPAVLVAYSLLLAITFNYWGNPWREPLGGLIFVAVILVILLMIRQFMVYQENTRLRIKQMKYESEAHLSALVSHSSDLIAITNPHGIIQFISPAVWSLLGYHQNQLEMTSWLTLLHPEDQGRGQLFFQKALQEIGMNSVIEWRIQHHNQSWIHVETVASNHLDNPVILGIVLNSRDISERRALEQHLWQQAHYDSLTKLANRVLFRDRVEHAVKRAQRNQQPLAVMFLDLDNFKAVNDNLGHSAGDQVLIDMAQRLVGCTRTCDTVARLGGDEFAVLIEDIPSFDNIEKLAKRMIEALRIPFALDHKDVLVTASIGIVIDAGEQDLDELLSNADKAMYAAKARGKQCYEFWPNQKQPAMNQNVAHRGLLWSQVPSGCYDLDSKLI